MRASRAAASNSSADTWSCSRSSRRCRAVRKALRPRGPRFGNVRLNAITTDQVEAWVTSLRKRGVGDSTIVASLGLLKSVLNHARIRVADGVSGPALKPARARALETHEVARLTEAVDERYRALILTLAYRGLRIGEAVALRVGDIDLLRGELTVSKTLSEVGGRAWSRATPRRAQGTAR